MQKLNDIGITNRALCRNIVIKAKGKSVIGGKCIETA